MVGVEVSARDKRNKEIFYLRKKGLIGQEQWNKAGGCSILNGTGEHAFSEDDVYIPLRGTHTVRPNIDSQTRIEMSRNTLKEAFYLR